MATVLQSPVSSIPPRLLILGASGMLGHTVLRWFARDPGIQVFGSTRQASAARRLQALAPTAQLLAGVNADNPDELHRLFAQVRPTWVINCIGLVKQLADAQDPLIALPVNAMLPHRLSAICGLVGARLIHISTDCVFSGRGGNYREVDAADAEDVYGRSKLMGEVVAPHALTLRTSIIGPELDSCHGLLAWFLSQKQAVKGYRRARFSGLSTLELAKLIERHVLPNPELSGLYHVASSSISKYELLGLLAKVYGHAIEIKPDDQVHLDRSLDASKFLAATGYAAPAWTEMLAEMREFG